MHMSFPGNAAEGGLKLAYDICVSLLLQHIGYITSSTAQNKVLQDSSPATRESQSLCVDTV